MPATLASMRIRNFALVEDLFWEPGPGFTAITGETGAGKSVLIGALTLLLGERADRGAIRTGADACAVEAVFEDVVDPVFCALLEEGGAEPCEGGRLLLKRTVSADGPGRQFVNGSPCTLALLRSLGDRLVDLHGPHDHQSLFSRERQTLLLDSYAKADSLRAEFAAARASQAALERERATLIDGEQSALREMDLLTHQVEEIERASLRVDEEEELVARHKAAANAARISILCAELSAGLSGEGASLCERSAEAVRATRELARLDPAAGPLHEGAEAVSAAASELAEILRRYEGEFDGDPAVLAALESRLDLVGNLKRKYGATLAEVLAFGDGARSRLAGLQGRSARAGSLDDEITQAALRTASLGVSLSAKRRKAAASLEKAVSSGLLELGFARCEFSIGLEAVADPGPLGCEVAEFVFAPNPGEAPRPLRAIASSGEISRVMLALKGALAEQDEVPLLVFDEIDANVGGEIAGSVAERMRLLAQGRQVLCITHLPQVAAAASRQFVVRKEIAGGRTRTLLEACHGQAREEEIARMLGGLSATALAHARDLLIRRGPVPQAGLRAKGPGGKRVPAPSD